MAHESYDSFEAVKIRLDQIVDAVNDENLPLDEALSLYEEAVGLGLRASDLLEENIEAHEVDGDPAEGVAGDGDSQQAGSEGGGCEPEEEPVHEGSSSSDAAADAAVSA